MNEATEVLSVMLYTHKCLLESGVEIQKCLEFHLTSNKVGIFRRPRSASLEDTPKKLTKEEKRVAASPFEDKAPLLRATLIVSSPSGEKPVWTGGESWSVRRSLGMT